MYSITELKLLSSPPPGYPLLNAAARQKAACESCSHKNVNVHSMLKVALNKYKSDKQFIDYVDKLIGLPCSIAGVYLTKGGM